MIKIIIICIVYAVAKASNEDDICYSQLSITYCVSIPNQIFLLNSTKLFIELKNCYQKVEANLFLHKMMKS